MVLLQKKDSFSLDPPEDLIDSRGPSSIPSITSEDSFPNVPIECIPTARVPVKGPNPVIGKRTNARINSGNALITFNICLVTLLKVFNEKLFAAKNAIGKLKNAPITVPAQAINNDSPTLGTILSIASWERSRGNIAVIRIQTLLGAVKNLSGVISRPEADHKDPAMIRNVITYF